MNSNVQTARLSLIEAASEGGSSEETPAPKLSLQSPAVGRFRVAVREGELLGPGQLIGYLFVLERSTPVVVPKGAGGRVVELPARGELPVAYDDQLLVLDPSAHAGAVIAKQATKSASEGVVFCAPMSGRFYVRPAPDQPPFVEAGGKVKTGQPVGLLEVMKTFNRIPFGGDDLPDEATILRVVPADGDDVDKGDVLLELKP